MHSSFHYADKALLVCDGVLTIQIHDARQLRQEISLSLLRSKLLKNVAEDHAFITRLGCDIAHR